MKKNLIDFKKFMRNYTRMSELKEKIKKCVKKWQTITFDDLEIDIPEIKDDEKSERGYFLSYEEPYEKVLIWALKKEGIDAINELLREKEIELVPFNPPMIGFM